MRLAWLTDIHLNFLPGRALDRFLSSLRAAGPEVVLLGGDTGEAADLERYLPALAGAVQRPVYFVLGNHDFYGGSIERVRAGAASLAASSPHLHWLSEAGVVELAPDLALVGHDGWADGRCGDYANSEVLLTDYFVIGELSGMDPWSRLRVLNRLGDETAEYFRRVLPAACDAYPLVIVLTHPPPFREACWHQGGISGEDWLPHFVCQAGGEALIEVMRTRPRCRLMVLCGHTHSSGIAYILPNLVAVTGEAEYGKPRIQKLPSEFLPEW
ncbi:MAG: metallophosphoesterase [Bryobacterales bacterium]|nr:metallophosphoesterase [Bryobacterales bacterium]